MNGMEDETVVVEGHGEIRKVGPYWLDYITYEDPLMRYKVVPHPEDKVWFDPVKVSKMRALWGDEDGGGGGGGGLKEEEKKVQTTPTFTRSTSTSCSSQGDSGDSLGMNFSFGPASFNSTVTSDSGCGDFSSSENEIKIPQVRKKTSTTFEDLQGFFNKFGATAAHVSNNYRPRKGKYRKEF